MSTRRTGVIFWVILIFMILTYLTFFALKSHSAERYRVIGGEHYVLVEKGDTLSLIAKDYLGDLHKWKYLAKINELKNPDLIFPGQKIYLEPVVYLSDTEKKCVAAQVSWKIMESNFYYQYRKIWAVTMSRVWALKPLDSIDPVLTTSEIKEILWLTEARLRWVDVNTIHNVLVSICNSPRDIILMTALIKAESDFRNVNGSHEEIGICQIKPKTAANVLPPMDQNTIITTLKDPYMNVIVGYSLMEKYLKQHEDDHRHPIVGALEEYNRGENKTSYAARIFRLFKSYMQIYAEQVDARVEEAKRRIANDTGTRS